MQHPAVDNGVALPIVMNAGRLDSIREHVILGRRAEALAAVDGALAQGVPARHIMDEALVPAMSAVGERYASGEFFLPQMLIAARTMSEAMQRLERRLLESGYARKGKAVLGTVAGDFHDIGKNIVRLMLEGNGWEVVDLGVDVSPETFVEATLRETPQFVLMSALLTLTMDGMRRTVEALAAAGVREGVVVGIGGAPVTQRYADEIGADFYGADAHACVEQCNRLRPRPGAAP